MAGVLLVLLLALPFVELAVFVQVSTHVGFLVALIGVVVLGLAGLALLKRQGLGLWRKARRKLDAGEAPSAEVVNGLLLLLAGLLLAFPGYVTGVAGLVLLVPPVRAALRAVVLRRFESQVRAAFESPAGVVLTGSMGGGSTRIRVDAGRATYGASGGVRDVHEVPRDHTAGPAPSDGSGGRPQLGRG